MADLHESQHTTQNSDSRYMPKSFPGVGDRSLVVREPFQALDSRSLFRVVPSGKYTLPAHGAHSPTHNECIRFFAFVSDGGWVGRWRAVCGWAEPDRIRRNVVIANVVGEGVLEEGGGGREGGWSST